MKKRGPRLIWKAFRASVVNPNLLYPVLTILLATLVVGMLAAWLVFRTKSQPLVLYSGQEDGIYFPLAKKIKKLVADKTGIDIRVEPSDGSRENLRHLMEDEGGRSLAIIQNDVGLDGAGDAVRSLLPLHSGVLHFIVREDSPIRTVSDLRDKVVAKGPRESGTPPIFDALLSHYGIDPHDEIVRDDSDIDGACAGLREGTIHAIVMTMGLKAKGFETLVDNSDVRFVGIGESVGPGSEIEGFLLSYPFVQSILIPRYAYRAPRDDIPGVPREAVPAVSVRAVLVANKELPPHLANEITRTLLENRSVLVSEHPSAAQITEGFDPSQLHYPVHSGSNRYLNRNEPGYLRQNAEVLGFLLSFSVAVFGFLISMKRWTSQRKKERIDEYYIQLDQFQTQLRDRDLDLDQLQELDDELWRMNQRAVRQLASEKLIANESFRIFQASLCEGRNEIRRRIDKLNP